MLNKKRKQKPDGLFLLSLRYLNLGKLGTSFDLRD